MKKVTIKNVTKVNEYTNFNVHKFICVDALNGVFADREKSDEENVVAYAEGLAAGEYTISVMKKLGKVFAEYEVLVEDVEETKEEVAAEESRQEGNEIFASLLEEAKKANERQAGKIVGKILAEAKSDEEIVTEIMASTFIGAIVASCGERRRIETEEEAEAILHGLYENGQRMRKILRGEDSWGLGKTDYEEAREQLGLNESYVGDIYWWVEDGMNTNYICFDC